MNQYTPQEIGIELVKGCNFTCQMCPVPLYREEQAWQFMSIDLVEKTVSEIENNDSIKVIWLAHFGEPLAHPKLRECLQIIGRVHRKFKRRVVLHTNGSLLEKERADALLQTDTVTELTFSFDGFGDKASFEFLRGPHFDKVLNNINNFSQQARQQRADLKLMTCSVMPKASEMKGWEGEIPDKEEVFENYKGIFNPLGVTVQPREMIDFSGNEQLPISADVENKLSGGCHFVEKDSLYVAASGKVQPCCAVYNEDFNVGSIQENNFEKLLNNEVFNSLRGSLRLDQRDGLAYCHNCKLSTGGDLPSSQLQKFWLDRHDKYPLNDQERLHIFGLLDPASIQKNQLLLKILQDRVNHKLSSSTPVGCIDSVQLNSNTLTIIAWVADEQDCSPLDNFQVFMDDKEWKIAEINYFLREDVAEFWQKPEWLFSGVKLTLLDIDSAKHDIKLEVTNSGKQKVTLMAHI